MSSSWIILGSSPSEPQFFMKPDTALLRNNDPFYVPSFSNEVHYETELVVRINRVGRAIEERFASRYYDEVGLGIDFTARDLQRECIAKGLPWERAKAFDYSAALSPEFIPLSELGRRCTAVALQYVAERRVEAAGRHFANDLRRKPFDRIRLSFCYVEDRRPALHGYTRRGRARTARRPDPCLARRTAVARF